MICSVVALLAACGDDGDEPSSGVTAPATSTTIATAGVRVGFELTAQTELVSPEGVHVLIDVADPSKVLEPVTDQDILLTTHDHPDHQNEDFVASFPGTQLWMSAERITSGDVTIQGIASVHTDTDTNPTNYIYVIDIGDLRIVHFGDSGLAALPADQLAAVGSVDVAISQFDNDYSDVTPTNEKGFALMQQVQPRLIIPTHQSDESVPMMTRWPCLYTDQHEVTLTSDEIGTTTRVLFMGAYAVGQGRTTGATLVDW